ncbi:glycosyltransferase family A protein [Cecembia sp.]|uniref:glycosyltransferase family 2 protein n=1 Tax=Cecembia sp. TaxID=1898110 RepID=UPI0025BE4A58|nr:glycosyltransferase family A protein [Cecembia sp.]
MKHCIMDESPLLSIICTVFNQEAFLTQCLAGIAGLSYPNLEIFLVDNGSSDDSRAILKDWVDKNRSNFTISTIFRDLDMPYCQSFNQVLAQVNGKYLIDLSGDDILQTQHAIKSITRLEENPLAALSFSDAFLYKEGIKKSFYPRDHQGRLKSPVIEGELYEVLVARHHVLSVTMVLRTDFIKEVGGYDESLAYEDFDIQVRLARKHPFVFSDHIGLIKTIHPKAFSAAQYKRYRSVMLPSTLKICQKIQKMNRTRGEDEALKKRLKYELKHALFSANFEVADGFLDLLEDLNNVGQSSLFIYKKWLRYQWDFSGIYVFLKSFND